MAEDQDRAAGQARDTPPEPAPGGVRHDTFTVTLRLSAASRRLLNSFLRMRN